MKSWKIWHRCFKRGLNIVFYLDVGLFVKVSFVSFGSLPSWIAVFLEYRRLVGLETYSAPQAGYFLAWVHGFSCQQDAFKEMGWENPHDFSSKTLEVVEMISYSNVFNVVADWCVSSRDGIDWWVAVSPLWRNASCSISCFHFKCV